MGDQSPDTPIGLADRRHGRASPDSPTSLHQSAAGQATGASGKGSGPISPVTEAHRILDEMRERQAFSEGYVAMPVRDYVFLSQCTIAFLQIARGREVKLRESEPSPDPLAELARLIGMNDPFRR